MQDEGDLEDLAERAAEEQLPYLERESLSARQSGDRTLLDLEIRELEQCVELARSAVVGRNEN